MIKKELYGALNGANIFKYTIVGEIIVSIIDFGARIVSLLVPDKSGKLFDVALKESVEDFLTSGSYMGATIGRCANRIGEGGFEIDGNSYKIRHKENAAHLHGGKIGFDKKQFKVSAVSENALTMTCFSPDGEEGYPGNLDFSVTFTVKNKSLVIEYRAVCDKDTVFNPTNHTYFNLNGESDGSILDNVISLNADSYLPTNKLLLPTGEVKSVEGTPFDFRKEKPIGRDIDSGDADLLIAGGYDHNFCLDKEHFATAYSYKTGIKMDAFTDMPGVQFYTGNFLKASGNCVYDSRAGFCLETQFYPDAIHHPEWKSPILKKNEKFYSKTEYRFSLKE